MYLVYCVQLRILNQYARIYQWYQYLIRRPAHFMQVRYVFSMFSLHILEHRYIYEINHTVSDILATFFMRAHWKVSTSESHVSKHLKNTLIYTVCHWIGLRASGLGNHTCIPDGVNTASHSRHGTNAVTKTNAVVNKGDVWGLIATERHKTVWTLETTRLHDVYRQELMLNCLCYVAR